MLWGKIGETAGKIHRQLQQKKEATPTELIKAVKVPYDELQMALGWLARENKIKFEKVKTRLKITLR
jgi:transcription initiation factor IIE alpha subunit